MESEIEYDNWAQDDAAAQLAYEDQMHLYSASFLDDAARERPALDQLEDTLAKVASIDTAKLAADVGASFDEWRKLRARSRRILAALEVPLEERNAEEAALGALAKLIGKGFST